MAGKKKRGAPIKEKYLDLEDMSVPEEGEPVFEEDEISLGVTVDVEDSFLREVERRRRKSGCP